MEKYIKDNLIKVLSKSISEISTDEPIDKKFVESLTEDKLINLVKNIRFEILNIFNKFDAYQWGNDFLFKRNDFLSIINSILTSISTKNVEIEKLNYELKTSYLTDLPNQKAAVTTIMKLIEQNHPFAWTFFDLDRLKSINLALGEHVTDRLIRSVGERLKDNVRLNEPDGYNDMVAHRSGDEFWLILNHSNLQGGMIASQKLLESIECKPINISIYGDDFKYTKELELKLKNKDKEGKIEKFEEFALYIVKLVNKQVSELKEKSSCISKRVSDKGKQVYHIKIPITASMGCAEFKGSDNPNLDPKDYFNQMISKIKFAEERSKMDGRNCVRGYDGNKYYVLSDEKRLLELNENPDSVK